MPNYPKYKINLRYGEVFSASIVSINLDGSALIELPNTSLSAIIESDLLVGDKLSFIVVKEKPLTIIPHSVHISGQINKDSKKLDDIIRVLGIDYLENGETIIIESSKVSHRIVKKTCIEINNVLRSLEEPDIIESIYIMNLMSDSKVPVTLKSYETVLILFESQYKILTHLIKAIDYLIQIDTVDERLAFNSDNKYTTNIQYLLDYHSSEGIYQLLISKGLLDDKFKNCLVYFDALLYWNSIATINGSPLLVPLVIEDIDSVYGIRLIHLWFNKLDSKSSFLFNDIFRLKAELDNDNLKVTYDNSDLNLDINKLSRVMDEQGYRLQGYNMDKAMIFLDKKKNLSSLGTDTTFVI